MKVDVHAHLFPRPFVDALERAGGGLGLPGQVARAFPALVDIGARIDDLDRLGIDHQVLSLGPPGTATADPAARTDLARRYNDEIAAAAAPWPGRFLAFAALPPDDTDAAVAELQRAVGELGAVGAQLFTNVDGRYADAAELHAVYDAAQELGVPVFLHPTTPACLHLTDDLGLTVALGFLYETALVASRLVASGTMAKFDRLDVILSHLGAFLPFTLARFDAIAANRARLDERELAEVAPPSETMRRFWLDTVSHHEPAYRCAVDTWGTERLLLGSDYPYSNWQQCVTEIEELGLPAADTAAVLGGNATRLLRLPTG